MSGTGVALQRVIGSIVQGQEQRQRNKDSKPSQDKGDSRTRDVWKRVVRSMKKSGASDGRHRTSHSITSRKKGSVSVGFDEQ